MASLLSSAGRPPPGRVDRRAGRAIARPSQIGARWARQSRHRLPIGADTEAAPAACVSAGESADAVRRVDSAKRFAEGYLRRHHRPRRRRGPLRIDQARQVRGFVRARKSGPQWIPGQAPRCAGASRRGCALRPVDFPELQVAIERGLSGVKSNEKSNAPI